MASAGPSSTSSNPPSSFKLTLKLGSSSNPSSTTSTPTTIPIINPIPPIPIPVYQPKPSTSTVNPTLINSNVSIAPSSSIPIPLSNSIPVSLPPIVQAKTAVPKLKVKKVKEVKDVDVLNGKYKALQKKYDVLMKTQEDTSIALFRSQKRIVRAREEKAALLDRILLLESAAGLTNDEVNTLHSAASTSTSEYPLLDPPASILLKPRPRVLPIITTSTDLTHSTYNDPIGPTPLPDSYPPRQRSSHLISSLAASKLREDKDARRIAKGLPKVMFPAIFVLGLEGSKVAEAVERALAGEIMVPVKEKSQTISSKGKGREVIAPPPPPMIVEDFLPNPFEGAGAAPLPKLSTLPAVAIATISQTEELLQPTTTPRQENEEDFTNSEASRMKPKPEFDDSIGSPLGSAMSLEDDNRTEDGAPARKHRKVETGEKVKTKKPKVSGITSGTFSIPFIQRHENGSAILPLHVGIMVLQNLGIIDNREHFHTERYIFPIGYECVRKYPSMIHKTDTTSYSCRIVDGGDESPRFEISPADQPGVILSGATPTGAWSQIVKAANHLRERNHSNSVSGPDYYGLAQNVVKALIQELPGASDIPGYIWQQFIEDPDPSLPDSQKRKRVSGGPTKVVGMRRKFKEGEEGVGGGNGIAAGAIPNQAYNPRSFSRGGNPQSSQSQAHSSTSPTHHHHSPSQFVQYPSSAPSNSSSLSSLVHHSESNISNPYDLPGIIGSLDSTSSILGGPQSPTIPNFYDPYAIPPPNSNYSPPSNNQPMFATDNRWDSSTAGGGGGRGEEEVGNYYGGAFDSTMGEGRLPGQPFGRRTSSSDGSL